MKQLNRLQADITHYWEKVVQAVNYNNRKISVHNNRATQMYNVMRHIDTLESLIKEAENALLSLQDDPEHNRREIENLQILLGYVRRGKLLEPDTTDVSDGHGEPDKQPEESDDKKTD